MKPTAAAAGTALAQALKAEGWRPVRRSGLWTWETERDGRTLRVSLLRRSRTRYHGEIRSRQLLGLTVGVDCSTSVQGRLIWWVPLGLADNPVMRWLNRRRGIKVLRFPAQLPPGRGLMTHESAWAEQVVASPAMEVVAALFEQADDRPMGASLMLQPGRWSYTAPLQQPEDLRAEVVAQQVNTLVELAQRVEALPPPRRPLVLTAYERWIRDHPVLLAVGLLLGATGLLGAAMLGLLLGVTWLFN